MEKNININSLLLERVVLLTDVILDLRKDINDLKNQVADKKKKCTVVPMKIG